MCSTVIFQYKCGCAERVVFECPFSWTTVSNASTSLRALSHQNCSRRYRIHQQKLFPPENATTTVTTPSSHQEYSQSFGMKIPILPPPKLVCPRTGKMKEQKAGEAPMTELDEKCHDCWQSDLRLARQKEDSDTASSTSMRDCEMEVEDLANTRILRERSVNELILPPPPPIIPDSGVTSSADGFFVN
ncbi:hypothetical protein F4801DRAFT_66648 [Xylaria longipes]|nr:hypothetical protein F4801DRAFT_66648 [Xylaria longipes]